MLVKLLRLLLSKPALLVRLVTVRRVKNAIIFFASNKDSFGQLYNRYRSIYGLYQTLPLEEIRQGALRSPFKDNVLMFPIIDWDYRQQRPQHLAENLASLGYRIFYFSTSPLMDTEGPPYRIISQPCPNVFVCRIREAALKVDDLNRNMMSAKTRDGYAVSLDKLMSDLGVKAPIVLLHHPYWTPLAQSIPGARVGYDCLDYHCGFIAETGIDESERTLIKTADFVVASSTYLQRKIGATREAELIPNGCDYNFFSRTTAPPGTSSPVAGYIGAIAEWFDVDLVAKVAERMPNWRFILVGSTSGCETSVAKRFPNIEFVGEIRYEEVPEYLAAFDVCMIPFKINELTKATNPVKVYEYLAAGRAVVSTPLPEVESLADKIKIASTADEFAAKLEESLHVDASLREDWRRWAAGQDWHQRAVAFESVMKHRTPLACT